MVNIWPYVVTFICVAALIVVIKLWKGRSITWGWLGLLMVFLPQAQGLGKPNGTAYILFGLVSTFVGILIFTFDMTRGSKEAV